MNEELVTAIRTTAEWLDEQTRWNYDSFEVKVYHVVSEALLRLASELEADR